METAENQTVTSTPLTSLKAGVTVSTYGPETVTDRRATNGLATRFKPGVSGNPYGPKPGYRQVFSAGFLRDLAEVWQAEGRGAMLRAAKTQPAIFFAVCARLIPSDVKLTVEQSGENA